MIASPVYEQALFIVTSLQLARILNFSHRSWTSGNFRAGGDDCRKVGSLNLKKKIPMGR